MPRGSWTSPLKDLGEWALKNITRSVRAYRIATGIVPVYQSSCGGRSEEPPLTARIRRVTPRPRCRRCQRIAEPKVRIHSAPAEESANHRFLSSSVPSCICCSRAHDRRARRHFSWRRRAFLPYVDARCGRLDAADRLVQIIGVHPVPRRPDPAAGLAAGVASALPLSNGFR